MEIETNLLFKFILEFFSDFKEQDSTVLFLGAKFVLVIKINERKPQKAGFFFSISHTKVLKPRPKKHGYGTQPDHAAHYSLSTTTYTHTTHCALKYRKQIPVYVY